MTVLWDPYQPKSTSTRIDEDYHTDSSGSRSDRKHDDDDKHHHHDNDDDDVSFTAPDKWEYIYDIEVWHKKAVMHDDKSFNKL
jgi:hypothetical protein